MILSERRNRILDKLRTSRSVSVSELADFFAVSESTIRRDLEVLDRNGELTRTYGGATQLPGMTVQDGDPSPEDPYDSSANVVLKSRMAQAALSRITDGDVVFLDIGTSTTRLAALLHGRDITVVTANLAVFDELRDDSAVRLVLLGGVVRRNMRTLVGSLTRAAIGKISADVLFLSCTGVRADGSVVDDMLIEAPLKQELVSIGAPIVLLADETKFPGTGALKVCSLADVHTLVTTSGAPHSTTEICRTAGGEVVIA